MTTPHTEQPIPNWLERIVVQLPGPEEARTYSLLALAVAVLMCAFSLYFGFRGETFLGRALGADFVQFYAAGQLLNQHQPSLMYDLPAISKLEHQDVPTMPSDQILIFAYAPCVAELFRPLAILPYAWAYCVWLAFSLVVYTGGLVILFRKLPDEFRKTSFLLALSAPIYMVETWIGGQLSVVTFFVVVVFVRCFESRRFLLAGLLLGLTSCKPSLVAIPAAVILLKGSWQMLAGLCTSSAFVALASFATAGKDGIERWMQTLRLYSSLATTGNTIIHRTKYMDLNSFFTILLGEGLVSRVVADLAIVAALVFLTWTCWQTRNARHEVQRYLWAGALAWVPIINIYVGVYDGLIIVPALVLVAYSSLHRGVRGQTMLQVWVAILWPASWISQPSADYLHVQILTVVVAAFGYWALTLALESAKADIVQLD